MQEGIASVDLITHGKTRGDMGQQYKQQIKVEHAAGLLNSLCKATSISKVKKSGVNASKPHVFIGKEKALRGSRGSNLSTQRRWLGIR